MPRTTLVDLHPLNNIRAARRSERLSEVAVNAPILALPAVLIGLGAALRLPALGYVAGSLALLSAIAGLVLWWMPYLIGVAAPWVTAGTGVTWVELHARTYAHTLIVLPRIGDRPRPNLEHMILHILFLAAAGATFLAAGSLAAPS